MGKFAVHQRVYCIFTSTQNRVKCGNFWCHVSDVPEESTDHVIRSYENVLERVALLWLAISKVVHNNVKSDDLVRLRKQRLFVIWHEREVIEIV